MSEDNDDTPAPEGDEPEKKSSKLPLILGLVLCLAAAGGGFYATFSGMLSVTALMGGDKADGEEEMDVAAATTPTFFPVGETIIPLGPDAEAEFLLMTSEIEIDPKDLEVFQAMLPRIQDLFNTYLTAVEARDLEQPNATMRLRDQLLRRLQVIAEPAKPRDLLFTSFILK